MTFASTREAVAARTRELAAAKANGRAALDAMDAGDPEPVRVPVPAAPAEVAASPKPKLADAWSKDRISEALVRWAERHDGHPPVAMDWAVASTDDYPGLWIVKKQFRSWADAVEAAGFPRPTRGGRARGGHTKKDEVLPAKRPAQREPKPAAAVTKSPRRAPAVQPEAGDLERTVLALAPLARAADEALQAAELAKQQLLDALAGFNAGLNVAGP